MVTVRNYKHPIIEQDTSQKGSVLEENFGLWQPKSPKNDRHPAEFQIPWGMITTIDSKKGASPTEMTPFNKAIAQ